MKLGAKIYYLKNTEEIILIEKDRKGFVKATSIEEDWNNYYKLNKYNIEAIDRIELGYGELDKLLKENKANSFYIEEGVLVFKYINKDTGEEEEAPEGLFKKTDREELEEKLDAAILERDLALAELIESLEEAKLERDLALVELTEFITGGGGEDEEI